MLDYHPQFHWIHQVQATSNNQTASATATIGAGGTVTAINLSTGGLGYGSTPSITLSEPLPKTLTEIETLTIQDPGFAYTTGASMY